MKFFIFCLILLATLAVSPSMAEAPAPMLAGGEEVYRAFVGPDGIQHVAIIGGSYFFRPSHIIVRANVPVEFEVSLERGMIPHSLVINAPEAGIAIDEKLSTEAKPIRFTPTATGSYPFYCKNKLLFLKSHREKGMEGMLEVVE
jgi:plastocyanin domain-containing protein